MYVQILQGQTAGPGALRDALDRWLRDRARAAVDWLVATAGVTHDGTFIALFRFATDRAAQDGTDRPEQWVAEQPGLFDGDVTVHESSRTYAHLTGDPDQAGFVQMIQGRTSDPDRFRVAARRGAVLVPSPGVPRSARRSARR
jgi:hypothetical protein